MLTSYDYISIIIFIIMLMIYIFIAGSILFVKKQHKSAEFKVEKKGICDFLLISLCISFLIRANGFNNTTIKQIAVNVIISSVLGFLVIYLWNRFSIEKMNEAAYGINIEEMKEAIYQILQKHKLSFSEVNNDSDWLKDIRIVQGNQKAKIELHRNGDNSTLIFIRGLNKLSCCDSIITDLKERILVNSKEIRWSDNLRSLVVMTLFFTYFLLAIGSTFFYKLI